MHSALLIETIRAVDLREGLFRFACDRRFYDPGLSRFMIEPLEIVAPRSVVFSAIKAVCFELVKARVMSRAQVIELIRPPPHG